MHMTTKNSVTGGTPNQHSLWSYCFAIVSVFALADVFTGGLFRESLANGKLEYAMTVFAMIATVGYFASDGPTGVRFERVRSRQKL